MENAQLETHPAGTTLLTAGESNDALYVVQSGRVRILVESQGEPAVVGACGEGEIIGEMSMLGGAGASATVIAETDVQLSRLAQEEAEKLAQAQPVLGVRLYRSMATVLSNRLRTRNVPISPLEYIG